MHKFLGDSSKGKHEMQKMHPLLSWGNSWDGVMGGGVIKRQGAWHPWEIIFLGSTVS